MYSPAGREGGRDPWPRTHLRHADKSDVAETGTGEGLGDIVMADSAHAAVSGLYTNGSRFNVDQPPQTKLAGLTLT